MDKFYFDNRHRPKLRGLARLPEEMEIPCNFAEPLLNLIILKNINTRFQYYSTAV